MTSQLLVVDQTVVPSEDHRQPQVTGNFLTYPGRDVAQCDQHVCNVINIALAKLKYTYWLQAGYISGSPVMTHTLGPRSGGEICWWGVHFIFD